MRNPNGYGSVTKLSGNRRKPFWVRKTNGFNEKGHPIYITIGYAETREEGNILLAEFNKNPWDVDKSKTTLDELFELWKKKKMIKLANTTQMTLRSTYKHMEKYKTMNYKEIKAYHMQDTIDNCGKGYSTQGSIKSMWHHLDKLALELDISHARYSELITTAPTPETNRTRFTDEEIKRIWKLYDDYSKGQDFGDLPVDWLDTVLILIYTGFRIGEFLDLETKNVDLEQMTLKGGSKTNAGKNRIVPIHSCIADMVKKRYNPNHKFLTTITGGRIDIKTYRLRWKALMNYLNIDKTPHECRHTFRSLLDDAEANKTSIDLMMGHKPKGTGERVYTHKTIDALKKAIELINKPQSN